jgi:ubiquitin carboxyl-terminal hydrolase 5/13
MTLASAKNKDEIKAWKDETLSTCFHTIDLVQYDGVKILENGLAHCNLCKLKENLWMCLSCGNLGCGRAQYGGLGGNGHALSHYESCKHPIAVKMGSITPHGSAGFCFLI